MKSYGSLAILHNQTSSSVRRRFAMAVAMLFFSAGIAVAQQPPPVAAPAPESKFSTPDGYSTHSSVDLGGRIANPVGSQAMYATLVNLQSGPRVLGETFEMHALPSNKKSLIDNLVGFGSGFGALE